MLKMKTVFNIVPRRKADFSTVGSFKKVSVTKASEGAYSDF